MYKNFVYGNTRYGFVAPFLIGAIAGGGAVSLFNPYRPRPYYNYNPYYYPYY